MNAALYVELALRQQHNITKTYEWKWAQDFFSSGVDLWRWLCLRIMIYMIYDDANDDYDHNYDKSDIILKWLIQFYADIFLPHAVNFVWKRNVLQWNNGITGLLSGWGSHGAERHERPSSPPIQSSRSQADLRAAATGRRWSLTVPCSCRHGDRRPSPWQRAPAAAAISVGLVDVASCSSILRRRLDGPLARFYTPQWQGYSRRIIWLFARMRITDLRRWRCRSCISPPFTASTSRINHL